MGPQKTHPEKIEKPRRFRNKQVKHDRQKRRQQHISNERKVTFNRSDRSKKATNR